MPLEFLTFFDANQMNSTQLATLIDNTWKPNNHTFIVATNGGKNQLNANATVCDTRGVGYIGNDFNSINTFFFDVPNGNFTPGSSQIADTQANADAIVQPIVQQCGNHTSLKAWYLADEPFGQVNSRLQKLKIAFEKFDPTRPVTIMGIGLTADRGPYQSGPLLGLNYMMMDVYSIGRLAGPMDFTMSPFGLLTETFTTYVRKFLSQASYNPSTTKLLMLLQGHDTVIQSNPNIYSTRLPSVAETYAQMFMAVGEGADQIGFFTWQARNPDGSGNNGWTGIENMPTQWAAMTSFAARVQPFKDLLSDTYRSATQSFTAGAAYCSTLDGPSARKLLVLCNTTTSTGDFTITGSGAQASGFLRNLETNQIIAVGSTVNLASGAGRFYEWTASASGTPPGHNGVPTITITDYTQDVEAYWAGHPFNPESSAYNPGINIPAGALEIDVDQSPHNGSLWSAVQAAHAAVGIDGYTVIWCGTNDYDVAAIYPPNFTGRAKNNVQFREKVGATPRFLGIQRVIPIDMARDYVTWSQAMYWNDPTSVDDPANPGQKLRPRDVVNRYPIRGWYWRGITFHGTGTPNTNENFQNISISTARDMVFDNCTFQNITWPGGNIHPGHVTGNSRLWNIWFRNCTFRGRTPGTTGNLPRLAIYLDGLHGGGVVNCTFENEFTNEDILWLCNDDFLKDYNANGTFDLAEWPIAQFCVSYGNVGKSTYKHLDAAGRNNLVMRLLHTGAPYRWSAAWFDSKSNNVPNSLPPIKYRYTGNKVILCDVSDISDTAPEPLKPTLLPNLVRVAAQLHPDVYPNAIDPEIGQTTVRDNIVRRAGFSRWLSNEGNQAGILGPDVVSGNANSGTIPPPASGGGTPGAGVPTSLVFTTQPQNATAGQSIGTVVVEVRDATGSRVTTYNDPIVVSLAVNPGNAVLSGPTSVNAVNGLATFTGLIVDTAAVGYRLRAVSSVDVSAQSAAFDTALPGAVGAYRPGTISHVTSASVPAPATLNNATIARPSGVLDADLGVFVLYREAQAEPTSVPSGFALVAAANFGPSYRAWVYAGPMGAATSYVFGWAAAAWRQASLVVLRGQDASQGIDVAGVFGTDDANGTQVTAPSITTVTDYAVVLGVFAIRSGGTIWTPPAGFTARTGAQAHIHVATAEQHPPGASGSKVATVNLNGPRAAMLLAIRPAASTTPAPQYARPASDGAVVGWVAVPAGGSLASKIDESVLDESDYIESPAGPTSGSTFRVKLGSVSPPGSTSGHRVSVRMAKSAAGGQQVDVTFRLVQGANTLIRTWTVVNISEAMTTYTLGDLTTGEAASITNYADLYLEGYAVGAGS